MRGSLIAIIRTAGRRSPWLCVVLIVLCRVPAWAGDATNAGVSSTTALTPLGMFLNADPIVKGIILALLGASIATWTVFVAKSVELMVAKRQARRDLDTLRGCRLLREAQEALGGKRGVASRLLREASAEIRNVSTGSIQSAVEGRVRSRLDDVEAEVGRSIRTGTGILATIGSTSPFVGLFGTVWGIMNSFIGIAASHTTNLAVVAPGIAEALLATAIGLVAAIPAVVVYNVFARSIGAYRALIRLCATEVFRSASRDLEHEAQPSHRSLRQAAE